MSTTIKISRDEIRDNPNINPNAGRMQRLKDLVCAGPWDGDDDIYAIYWQRDPAAPGGEGYWVACKDPDQLAASEVIFKR